MTRRGTLQIAAVLGLLAGPAPAAAAELRVAGPAETVFDWSRDRCARWDSPDTPARAWRGADGRVRLVAGAEESRASLGPGLDALTHACGILYRGSGADDPAALDDRVWIHAVHAAADGRVIALGHAEYHGHLRRDRCPVGGYLDCWVNGIVELVSEDGGASFRREGPPVAAPAPGPSGGSGGGRRGYFNPSNIVARDGFLSAFVFAEAEGAQARGPCLIRRPEAGSAADWRAWDGTGFSVRLVDGTPCQPVAGIPSTISSVAWQAPDGPWLAVTPAVRRDAAGVERSGIWWSRSPDLLHWEVPRLLLEAPLFWRRDCGAGVAHAYPSLLDPDSADPDFATVDGAFWLYLVQARLGPDCRLGPDRDLVRIPLRRG